MNMTEIAMPRLSDSMEEGTILKWLIADGQAVAVGQELVEIETDKATITHAAEMAGVLEILASEGTTVPVGAAIARVGAGAGRVPDLARSEPAAPAGPPASAEPIAASEPAPLTGGAPAANGAAPVTPATLHAAAGVAAKATPLARRAALLHAVELERVPGSGPRGRVTREDVLRFAGAEPQAPSQPAAPPGAVESAKGERLRVEPSRLQQLVARRMAEAKATIPDFQVQTEVVMDAALALRAGLKASAKGGGVPSINDFIVKACATALRRHPRANGSYADGGFDRSEIVQHGRINIGVAVAAGEALIVPVIADADTRSLGAIARESRRLADRVRAGEITPPELSGGTFTVSNLGMYGMTAITPVINPPQAAILGVGALRETLARLDGEIVERTLMTLTLSCDHRILYGADAARLLADVRTLLEQPLGLAL
jgi:pyruvate dehydrogenase E2 component (dihydrolipoamide acetyltransferase)